jgi:hypothetical protein
MAGLSERLKKLERLEALARCPHCGGIPEPGYTARVRKQLEHFTDDELEQLIAASLLWEQTHARAQAGTNGGRA